MSGGAIFRDASHSGGGRGDRAAGDRGRHREKVREAIRDNIGDILADESIIGQSRDKVIKVPIRSIKEYRLIHGKNEGGVATGDGETQEGQVVGKGDRNEGGPGDEAGDQAGQDMYETEIELSDLLDIMFEDLELPDMERKKLRQVESKTSPRRLGYRRKGPATHLSRRKTARERIRRISGRKRAVDALEARVRSLIEERDHNKARISNARNDKTDRAAGRARARALIPEVRREAKRLDAEIAGATQRLSSLYKLQPHADGGENFREHLRRNPHAGDRLPFTGDDLRYKKHVERPKMESNAVVICIMDTSGSMDVMKKYLARSFYFLLYNFIMTRYSRVEIVFVAHHTQAREVTEEEFFHKVESGGTFISSGYEKALEIVAERYHPDLWNVYAFHCSDGDNFSSDNEKAISAGLKLLEICNLFGYVEIKPLGERYYSDSMIDKFMEAFGWCANYHGLTIESKEDVWKQLSNVLKADERRHS